MPVSTCKCKTLNDKKFVKLKLIFITNKIPEIPESKKVISNKIFQIFLLETTLITFFFVKIYVIA